MTHEHVPGLWAPYTGTFTPMQRPWDTVGCLRVSALDIVHLALYTPNDDRPVDVSPHATRGVTHD